jgi:hypothetical protein
VLAQRRVRIGISTDWPGHSPGGCSIKAHAVHLLAACALSVRQNGDTAAHDSGVRSPREPSGSERDLTDLPPVAMTCLSQYALKCTPSDELSAAT